MKVETPLDYSDSETEFLIRMIFYLPVSWWETLTLLIFVAEPSQYMLNLDNWIFRINSTVAKNWLWRNEEEFEIELFFSQRLSFNA